MLLLTDKIRRKMSDSPVIDWSDIIHKDVRSNDGADLRIVDGVDDDYYNNWYYWPK
jgi:hypothetical protein